MYIDSVLIYHIHTVKVPGVAYNNNIVSMHVCVCVCVAKHCEGMTAKQQDVDDQ